ncbi:hypothetical protein HK103_007377 [Boothiomyces macroporosus]|uniref:NADH dehydrogenase [ubiquinone] 1 alpha subcomplex subunit 13 n=1 Tax=Boothiomyces macroporosus TaxID=261099 RepID=A0AAD5UKY2_9FUNG|nr:hypothetical protein HK103_007377 [Boothiomyces macroporosus]
MAGQDSAPAGGFPTTIKYKRNLPTRGPSGAVLLLVAGAAMTYGLVKTTENTRERREIKREKTWARIHLAPIFQAEADRDMVRRMDAIAKREAEIMKDHPEWAANDLKAPVKGLGKGGVLDENAAEPVYHTERYVAPTTVFLPPTNESFLDAQWWRGTKLFTKNPAYHDRKDFTKEHPIGE